jgi:malate dehydrogenase (oxaloacetate-decarboxylating)
MRSRSSSALLMQDHSKPEAGTAIAKEALRLHALYRGAMQVFPKVPITSLGDLAVWYTPGVAAPSMAIAADPERSFEYTNRGNSVAIVTDGTRVLGLGDIGPEAALPVMEGKALLFRHFGAVDAVPICLATKDPVEIVRMVEVLAPSFGAINLEDIAQPKCFGILDELRARLPIPVWHDDQQGTATVVLAGLINALAIVGKRLDSVRVALVGTGAANVAVYRLLRAFGFPAAGFVACDSRGTLHRSRNDIATDRDALAEKWRLCTETNPEGIAGGIEAALDGADICIAFSQSGPSVILPAWIRHMAKDAIVFACANPTPEIWPTEARSAGARICATGRSDFPNQVNNSLAFPGIFRGILDVRARAITEEVAIAAARELAKCGAEQGLRDDHILPCMTDWRVHARVAAAAGASANRQGLARVPKEFDELYSSACKAIQETHRAEGAMLSAKAPPVPHRAQTAGGA